MERTLETRGSRLSDPDRGSLGKWGEFRLERWLEPVKEGP